MGQLQAVDCTAPAAIASHRPQSCSEPHRLKSRMREIRTSGSVGALGRKAQGHPTNLGGGRSRRAFVGKVVQVAKQITLDGPGPDERAYRAKLRHAVADR